MADDDLDYRIYFPALKAPSPWLTCGDTKFETKPKREPTVILWSWAGCDEDDLDKYCSIYNKRGCITVSFRAPAKKILFCPKTLSDYAGKILELILDLALEEHPLVFHLFNSSGAYLYYYINEAVTKNCTGPLFDIRGCIFDSGPEKPGMLSNIRSVMFTCEDSFLSRIRVFIAAIFYFAYCFILSQINWIKGKPIQHLPDIWKGLRDSSSRWPQLFLYSKADKIVSYHSIEELAKYRQNMGVPIYLKCWENSPHLMHMDLHSEAYIQEIDHFLEMCLYVKLSPPSTPV